MQPLKYWIKNPKALKLALLPYCFFLSDRQYLKIVYKLSMGKPLNLDNPQSFNEKLNWLKLYNRRPEYTIMVDKYLVKEYVKNLIGSDYIIPLLGVWDSVDEIEWDKLPNQFVLKTTHGGGSCGVVICKNKTGFDIEKAKSSLRKSMKQDIYRGAREWPYKNVNRRIIAERFMEDKASNGNLNDYKFFCFDGQVKALFIGTDRFNSKGSQDDLKFDFFDENFGHLPFRQGHPNADVPPAKPAHFDLMKELAEKLSKGIPHVRVDFYVCNDRVYFGELTFFHFSGTVPFVPEEWDYTFGSWLRLPQKTKQKEDRL